MAKNKPESRFKRRQMEQETNESRSLLAQERQRDKRGRFLPLPSPSMEELSSESVRYIRLVKVRGTYGTYRVRERWLTDGQRTFLKVISGIAILAYIF